MVPSSRYLGRCRGSGTRCVPRAPASGTREAGGLPRRRRRGPRSSKRRLRRGGSGVRGFLPGRKGEAEARRAMALVTTERSRTTRGMTGQVSRNHPHPLGARAGGTRAGVTPPPHMEERLPPGGAKARSRSSGGATSRGGPRPQRQSSRTRVGRGSAEQTAAEVQEAAAGTAVAEKRERPGPGRTKPTTLARSEQSGRRGLNPVQWNTPPSPGGRFSCGVSPPPMSSRRVRGPRLQILARRWQVVAPLLHRLLVRRGVRPGSGGMRPPPTATRAVRTRGGRPGPGAPPRTAPASRSAGTIRLARWTSSGKPPGVRPAAAPPAAAREGPLRGAAARRPAPRGRRRRTGSGTARDQAAPRTRRAAAGSTLHSRPS
mmetsp:Transcript_35593/g.110995  ORF Transcript_35593/g.110995 Transcript_35593/m.110995 type:complete len:373 (-) Transcript_35593:112-1230(-)